MDENANNEVQNVLVWNSTISTLHSTTTSTHHHSKVAVHNVLVVKEKRKELTRPGVVWLAKQDSRTDPDRTAGLFEPMSSELSDALNPYYTQPRSSRPSSVHYSQHLQPVIQPSQQYVPHRSELEMAISEPLYAPVSQ